MVAIISSSWLISDTAVRWRPKNYFETALKKEIPYQKNWPCYDITKVLAKNFGES